VLSEPGHELAVGHVQRLPRLALRLNQGGVLGAVGGGRLLGLLQRPQSRYSADHCGGSFGEARGRGNAIAGAGIVDRRAARNAGSAMAFFWRRNKAAAAPPAQTVGERGTPFRAMTEGTPAQWARIAEADAAFAKGLPGWLFDQMALMRNERHGFAVDRLEHGLQTATRALRDGRDEEYVTCALFHDVGAALAPEDHAEFAALVLRPYVSERNHWMLRHHALFQSYYYAHHMGGDRNGRDRFRRHKYYQYTAEFCHRYDQAAFDPDYPSMTLDEFQPIVARVLAPRRGS
jgi:predicted HD phosphohydrolase